VLLAPAFARAGAPRWLPWLAAACAAAPDLDVIGLALGVPYGHALGHRGLSHSLPFAAAAAAAVTWLAMPRARPGRSRLRAGAALFLVIASHGLLDAATDGGLGVALLAPFDDTRFFWPLRPIAVSPLAASAFLSPRGASVLLSEALWLWLPVAAVAWLRRRRRAP
jgi:inner membrane protein